MTQEWKDLLAMVAQNGAINAEKTIDVLGEKESKAMFEARDNFLDLKDKINNDVPLEGKDFLNLWVGASISCSLIEKNIKTWTAVVQKYKTDLLPKLYEVAAASPDPEKQQELFHNYFDKNI